MKGSRGSNILGPRELAGDWQVRGRHRYRIRKWASPTTSLTSLSSTWMSSPSSNSLRASSRGSQTNDRLFSRLHDAFWNAFRNSGIPLISERSESGVGIFVSSSLRPAACNPDWTKAHLAILTESCIDLLSTRRLDHSSLEIARMDHIDLPTAQTRKSYT